MKRPLRLAGRLAGLAGKTASEGKYTAKMGVGALLLDALEMAMLGGETHYTVRPGIPALRRRISRAIQQMGGPSPDADDPADNVLITTGESESLFVTLLSLRSQNAAVLCSPSEQFAHPGLLKILGVGLTTQLDPGVCAIYRSSGLKRKEHLQLLEQARLAKLPDLLDLNSYWLPELPPTDGERTLIMGSLGGIEELAHFHVGYLVGPQVLMARCRVWKQAFSICTAAPSQRAAILRLEEEVP